MMKQYEAVIQTLERLGGQATLAQLYREVMQIKDCEWGTKTPFASIRRIVQTRPEIFRVRPGLWALRAYKDRLGLVEDSAGQKAPEAIEQGHAYYQGLLVVIGNLRSLATFVPHQDKNKLFVNQRLGELRTLQEVPPFSYEVFVKRISTVDVTWFNQRQMPYSLFEVEHSTNIQDSLLKFYGLQDFYTRMVIVADDNRRAEFEQKVQHDAFEEIRERVGFLGYARLVKMYEYEVLKSSGDFTI
ncbi:MAG TPA: hypothetical protein PLJ78_00825 [Anaerolineae bacterium]|nr:hypothetical protein [Anaerolineae bacterium]HQK12466.1 hypothetical protein [Anaerolineae bacterium]